MRGGDGTTSQGSWGMGTSCTGRPYAACVRTGTSAEHRLPPPRAGRDARLKALSEERDLEAAHGTDYAEYRRGVPMLIPRLHVPLDRPGVSEPGRSEKLA